MTAVAEPIADPMPRKRRFGVTPFVELGVLALAIAVVAASYFIISGHAGSQQLLTPALVASLLIANLIPCGALIVLTGRRIAKRRAARSAAGGGGQLHVRLVAIFSLLAAVPTVLLAVIASLLFQYGAEFWFSGRAHGVLENSRGLAEESYTQLLRYVDNENVALANDIGIWLTRYDWSTDSDDFKKAFAWDVYQRSLSNAVLFTVSDKGEVHTEAIVKNSDRNPIVDMDPANLRKVLEGAPSVVTTNARQTSSITRVPETSFFLFSAREPDANEMATRIRRIKAVFVDYEALLKRSRSLQLQFNIALLVISLIVIGVVVFVALAVADRLVRPINELVGAARRVSGGDLSARVREPRTQDEIGILTTSFNRMTGRLEEQTNALVKASADAESRRALIEAVMSGVSAGVISIDSNRVVRLVNASAQALLRNSDDSSLVGRRLAEVSPELDALLDLPEREAIVQLASEGEARTLAVKITRDEGGQVLTFDDITQQLLDQRRAAWSDVARRIAHEIKNPLTPIQLAAERLQRRYGKTVDPEDGVFARLTDTIIRQVSDLRRMVDEFSSFARMPKPIFRRESLLDIVRQAVFLHEVAHPAIRFMLETEDPAPSLVCDRRQLGQAMTNVVKNAVEAIEARNEEAGLPPGEVKATISSSDTGQVFVALADNGIGLPVERDRIVEPYMTTRSRGTGLGLAIVKKIVEEHQGTITFADRPGGGTIVTMCFDATMLAGLADVDVGAGEAGDARPAALTRTGTKA